MQRKNIQQSALLIIMDYTNYVVISTFEDYNMSEEARSFKKFS